MGVGDGQDAESGEGGSQAGSTASGKLIDLRDCLTDSPRFRHRLADHEAEVVDLETRLEKVVTSCDRMVNNGQAYVDACRSFSSCVRELAGHFHENSVVEQSLRRFYDTLAEVQSFHSILFDQAQRSVQSALRAFLTGELKKVKDMKKSFHRVSEELNSAIHRNAHAPRSKPQEADELSSQLANMQTQFSHTAIDYGYHINAVSCNKGHHLLNHLLSYMRAQYTFFHQGYDLLREFDPYMRHVLSQVDELQKVAEEDIASMNSRHNLVIPQHLKDGSPEEPLRPMDNPAIAIELEGYLFKRSSGAFKTWNRRWFVLRNNQLCYQSESKTEELVVVVEDLRICTIKMADDQERRFCFEVVTPIRSSMLQADSESLRKTWMTYLEGGIARALRITASNKKKDEHHELRVRTATLTRGRSPTPELSESPILGKKAGSMSSLYSLGLDFLDIPGNDTCADCDSINPKWASINLGIMLCIDCCGIHRNLGVHISKVRSITLDEWEHEIQMIMCSLGNRRVNAILEYEVPEHVKKPSPSTPRNDREAYIRAKYVLNAFVHPHPDFARPEIPVEPQHPSLQQLLSSNRERQADSPRSTPRSSPSTSKKMISPAGIRMRATKPKSYRPLSQSLSSGPDMLQSFDSDDDLLREFTASNTPNSSGATSSMALLAENYRKLEKSGKLKNWNIAKLKTPKKSSFTQLSGKFSKSYQALNRRFRSDSTKSSKSSAERDVHSDNEDPENSSETPLLHSESSAFLPPSKPPRTFKQRKLDLTGDGDAESALLYKDDDFSGDILSAIKEMGVVAVLGRECSEESADERFSKSLPNGGIQVLSPNGDLSPQSSPTGRVSPTPPLLSPKTVSPLASEPPARAFLPPPVLSPVHEGIAQAAREQPVLCEDSSSIKDQPALCEDSSSIKDQPALHEDPSSIKDPNSSASTVGSEKPLVSKITTEAATDSQSPVVVAADAGSSEGSSLPSLTTEEGGGRLDTPTSNGASPTTGQVSSKKPHDSNSDDSFTEFQSAPPVEKRLRESDLPRAASVDALDQDLKSPGKLLAFREAASLSFDDSKRVSMISVASGDWYSLDEEEDDNISNYSAEFPELECTVSQDGPVCPNILEEEQHLFSTPPSSPPIAPEGTLKKEKDRRTGSSSERSSSNSPRPKSASPLGYRPRRSPGAVAGESLLRRSCSPHPKSAGSRTSSSRGSTYEEAMVEAKEERTAALSQSHTAGPQSKPSSSGSSCEKGEVIQEEPNDTSVVVTDSFEPEDDTSELTSAVSLTQTEEGEENFDDSNETFQDAAEDNTNLEGSEMAASRSAVPVDGCEESKIQKSQSANTSPSSADIRKNASSLLTRSATDLALETKTRPLHTRSRSSTLSISGTATSGMVHRRSLEEAPDRSKDGDYFAKLIQKSSGAEKATGSRVAAFSDQDFADIFRSSLRGSKVPMVRVESADDRGGGDAQDGDKEKREREGQKPSENHLQSPCTNGASPEAVVPEPIEPLVIPSDISPDLYLYQSVSTEDIPAILCAKAHGANMNFRNSEDEGKSPMLVAVEQCNTVLVEFLYQNGAKLTVADEKGRGCLHYAALKDDASIVILLLKRGAKTDTLDNEGKDPVHIAVDQENGDIVTLLRIARLKQEEREYVEDQVAEVYKDFEVAVQVDPERMKRRSQASSDTSSIASRELKIAQ